MDVTTIAVTVLLAVLAATAAILATRARMQAAMVAAGTRLAQAEQRADSLAQERDSCRRERDSAVAAHTAAERERAVAVQRLADMEMRIADFERLKSESLKAAQAAILGTAQQLSSKLIEDHRRESAEAKKQGEAKLKETADHLLKQVEQITQSVAQLQGQVSEKGQVLDTVWRALTSPGGAGRFAEVGLANTLRSFGLEEGRDFMLQHTTQDADTGRRLRPDAVVFLPGNSVLVIDSKASKFVVDIAEAEGTDGEDTAYQNLGRTMNTHLKALAEKDYRSAVGAVCRQSGREGELARVLSVMYLPNDAALEKLHRADPEFCRRAAQLQIIPAGPAGLACAIGFASVEISFARQIENQERIVERAQALLDSLAVMLGHAALVGKGIKSAADAYAKLTGSVNARVLPRGRELVRLGLRPDKPLPAPLAAYQVMMTENDMIDGEAAAVEIGGETAATAPTPPPRPVLIASAAGE